MHRLDERCQVGQSRIPPQSAHARRNPHRLPAKSPAPQPASPAGKTSVAPNSRKGSTVILTAHPAAHNQLRAWGAGECKEEPSPTECEVEIGGSNSSVAAEFTPILHTPVSVAVDGAGSVSASAGSISGCAHGGGVCAGRIRRRLDSRPHRVALCAQRASDLERLHAETKSRRMRNHDRTYRSKRSHAVFPPRPTP